LPPISLLPSPLIRRFDTFRHAVTTHAARYFHTSALLRRCFSPLMITLSSPLRHFLSPLFTFFRFAAYAAC